MITINYMLEKTYLNRKILTKLQKWSDLPEIYAIKGPRQAGKTTLVNIFQNYLNKQGISPQNIHFITFEDRKILADFITDPVNYVKRRTLSLKPQQRQYFFIDEFQYLKQGGQKLKLLYDLTENIKFIITGSSSLEIANELGRFLVGRVFSFNLWPLDFEEFLQTKEPEIYRFHQEQKEKIKKLILENQPLKLSTPFFTNKLQLCLEEFTAFGGYPQTILSQDILTKQTILKNIYEAYLTHDIIHLLKITNTEVFTKIVSFLANQTGSLLNYQNLTNDSGSYFKEVQKFLTILEETYIIKKIRPYFKNTATELKKNPKIYFIDTGLRNSILGNFDNLEHRVDKGALIENFVLTELVKNIEEPTIKIRYWRTIAKTEVDFIVDKVRDIVPIEVKMSPFKKPNVSRSFRSFIEKYNPKIGLILTQDFIGKIKINSTQIYFAPVYYI